MPIKIESTAGDSVYASPFVGPVNHTAPLPVNIAALTTAEVDADGYIKPGLPLAADGTTVGAAERVYGIVIEPIKVAESNASADLTAAGTVTLTVATMGQVNRDVIESNLGRVLTANELAGFNLGGCHIAIIL